MDEHDLGEKEKTSGMMNGYSESIIDTVRESLIVLDHNLMVVSASRSFYDFFKVKPEETVGHLIYNLGNHQWDIPKLRELLETILPQKATFDKYEVEHNFSTIGRRVMLLNARQIERGKGKERIILLAIEDITERKEIEAGLEKTRKELAVIKKTADEVSEFAESVINTVREPLISLDQDLRVVAVSRSFYEFFKVKPEETVGQLIYDLGNKQWDIPKLRELLETILPQKATFDNYEVEHDFTAIGRRVMLLNARQIQRGFGKERIILLAIEDITERKEIEAGLEKTRKELAVIKKIADEASEFAESVINTVREPLISLDQNLRVVTVSRSFYEVFKVKPEETVGQLIYNLGNHQWDIPKLRELLEDILPKKVSFDNYEVEHIFATIGRRVMLLNARQIERGKGKERIILLAIEDITERKEIEAGLEKTRKELAVIKKTADEAGELLARRSADLEVVNKELETFAYSVSHDLRAPLRALDGFSLALLEDYEGTLDGTGKDYLKRIRAASQRMAELIDDMLKLSRITRVEMKYETVDLSLLSNAVMKGLQLTQPDRLVNFKSADGLFVIGDSNLLKVLLENLLGNAWKYTSRHPSAHIEFGSMVDGGRTFYFVKDDGAGFDMSYSDKLFLPFNRLHTNDEFPGIGIGLATSQRIVARHGGMIRAEGAVEKGAAFIFSLNSEPVRGG